VVPAKAAGSEPEGQHSVAKRLKAISESTPGPKSVLSRRGRILAENKARPDRINNAEEVNAEILVHPTVDCTGLAVPLAGVSAGDEIDIPVLRFPGRERPRVVVLRDVGPVASKDPAGVNVVLDLPPTGEPGPFEAEVEAAKPGVE